MELILWRHAEAEPHGFSADKDRKLTPLGQKQAKKMAGYMLDTNQVDFELVNLQK